MIDQHRTNSPATDYTTPDRINSMLARAKRDAILQAASGALVVLDANGTIISFNNRSEEQFAIPKRKAIGVHVDQILNVCELASSSFYEWIKLLDLEAEVAHNVVLNFNKADGSTEMAEVTVGKAPLEHFTVEQNTENPSAAEDRCYQYICVIRPVSTFKDSQIEDALKYLSHTLKTPLFGMLGLLSLALSENNLPIRSRHYLERANKSGEALAQIIERTLNKLQTKPSTQIAVQKKAEQAKEELIYKGRFSGKNILVVEDNLTNQIIAKGMLKKFGISPHTVENGEEAIAEIKRNNYDLILMDCNMPIMDGYTAAKMIRELPSPKNNTPIIAITATQVANKETFCETNKMDGYIAKPYRLDDIYHTLHLWLS
jgi:CheY-like chemotaxis protein